MNDLIFRKSADRLLAAADKVNETFEDLYSLIVDYYGEGSRQDDECIKALQVFLDFITPILGEHELDALSEARVIARKNK